MHTHDFIEIAYVISGTGIHSINGKDHVVIYEKMLREYILKGQGYIEILRAYLIELIINIFREYSRSNMREEPIETKNKNIIDKVIRYMKENYSKEIKIEDLSTIAFFSPSYFSKLFKESTSMTISEYIQNLRIKEACRLLTSTDYKVIEVALDVGYKDIKFFNQIFKKITGKTPSEYRNVSGGRLC